MDDEISERREKSFLKMLDPWKLYFYQSDVDEFEISKDDLDDRPSEGRRQLRVYGVQAFLQRIDERVKTVDELLGMKHDFTVDEEWWSTTTTATSQDAGRGPAIAGGSGSSTTCLTLKADKTDKARTGKEGHREAAQALPAASPSGCTRPTATNCWRCI